VRGKEGEAQIRAKIGDAMADLLNTVWEQEKQWEVDNRREWRGRMEELKPHPHPKPPKKNL
jgi:hypothetical protein